MTISHTSDTNHTILQGHISLLKYAPPILIPLGLLLNIIAISVPFLKQNRIISYYTYIGGLAIADTLVLVTMFGSWGTIHNLQTISHASCAALTYFYSIWKLMGILIIMAVTVDRAIMVSLPISHFTMRTTKRALLVMIPMAAFCVLYNIPYFILQGIIFDTKCTVVLGSTSVWTFEWFNVTLKVIIPMVFVLCLDVLIAKKLHLLTCRSMFKWSTKWTPEGGSTAAHRGTVGATSVSRDDISIEDRKSAITIVMMNIICLVILTSPRSLHYATVYLSDDFVFTTPSSPFEDYTYEVMRLLYLISVSVKTLIYLLTNPQFRSDAKEVFSIVGSWIYLLYHRIRS